MKTVGERLIELLEAYGVEFVFGIPGVHTVELYRGLAGSAIRHITPRHEQAAGFMADGNARVSGKPGARAFAIFDAGRPRPVHIEMPVDVMAQPAPALLPVCRLERPVPGRRELERAAALLGAATAPVIVAGGGAVGAPESIRSLAERLDAPVVMTGQCPRNTPTHSPVGRTGKPIARPGPPTSRKLRCGAGSRYGTWLGRAITVKSAELILLRPLSH